MAKNRDLLAKEIVRRFTAAISGTEEEQIIKYNPNDRIYVGKLSAQSRADDFSSSVLIKQISVDFRIKKEEIGSATLEIYPQGNFFFRVIPTFDQQKQFFFDEFSATFSERGIKSFEDLIKRHKAKNAGEDLPEDEQLSNEMDEYKVRLLPVYEKISIEKDNRCLRVKLSDIYNEKYSCGSTSVNDRFQGDLKDYVDELSAELVGRVGIIKCVYRDKIGIKDLESVENWNKYIERQNRREDFEMMTNFNFGVSVDLKATGEYVNVTVALTNETAFGDETEDRGQVAKDNDSYRITTLFNSGIKVRCTGADYVPIELDYFADDYKYDPNVYALGNNCNVDYDPQNKEIQTNHVPVFVQKRLKTNDSLAVRFDDLINDPVVFLNGIHTKMLVELKKWKDDYDNRIDNNQLTDLGKRQFKNEIDSFEIEIKRFKTGIDLIEKYNVIRTAFILMNRAFKECARGYDSWRLFQIVFVVSLILDIVAHESTLMLDDEVKNKAKTDDIDILYFPTGGGKTEAFLGILIFNLFFDRMRGKEQGVTAILKYPLRLLSVQQVQRVSNILAKAEMIRVTEGIEGDPFSLGYFVGEGNTPNKIEDSKEKELLEMTPDDLDVKFRLLDVCPFCGNSSVHVVYDSEKKALSHICSSEGCRSGGTIPLYMVDDDIYRSIPSVIISTVDKMTAIGMNVRFHNLLMGASFKCPHHGYTGRNKCLVKGCKCDPSDYISVKMKDPAPTLLIQDELHLIKESLGAYDSHYETLVEYFVKNLSGCDRGIKVIGATATISAYEVQAKHLYWKNAIRFPAASPYLNHNFYSFVDESDIGRIILGYAPFGKAIVNSVAYSLQYLKRVVYDLYMHPEKVLGIKGISFDGTKDEQLDAAKKILDEYWIILEYNNVKMESNRVIQAIGDPINTELIAEGIEPLESRKMTGDDTFQEVRSTLSAIEHAESAIDDLDFNLIVATSMISHGVDADRFNLMLFYGMPGNTAEYIQAYSRVGRKHPGIVIDIMRPSREKDQSYLKNFMKFHEYKDILVDSVSINRWATKAVETTLPGVLSSIILNYYLYEFQYTDGVGDISKFKDLKEVIRQELITAEDLKEHAYQVYKCSSSDSSIGKLYRERIDEMIDKFIDDIKNAAFDNGMYLLGVMDKCSLHVMTSLRDTDRQILVEMK